MYWIHIVGQFLVDWIFIVMVTSNVGAVATAPSPRVCQCTCGFVSESSSAGHRTTVQMGRTERTCLWSLVSVMTVLVLGCFVMEMVTRQRLEALAQQCLSPRNNGHSPQTDVTCYPRDAQQSTQEPVKCSSPFLAQFLLFWEVTLWSLKGFIGKCETKITRIIHVSNQSIFKPRWQNIFSHNSNV